MKGEEKLFDGRDYAFPIKYTATQDLKKAIRESYWLDTEVSFDLDKSEYKMAEPHIQSIIRRTLLAISTVEVKVKDFWGNIGRIFPHPEISMLGDTHAESETRHFDSYSKLLVELELFNLFKEVLEVPEIKGRFDYLNKYLSIPEENKNDKVAILIKIILFSVLIENVSLFGQFANIIYLHRHNNIMVNTRNIIDWTINEETIHFYTGAFLVNTLREEYPELFTEDVSKKVLDACRKSIIYESRIIDWIFEEGEFEHMGKEDLVNFLKDRVNTSLVEMGFDKAFEEELDLTRTRFFYEETTSSALDDFFAKRPVDYTVKDKPISGDDLF